MVDEEPNHEELLRAAGLESARAFTGLLFGVLSVILMMGVLFLFCRKAMDTFSDLGLTLLMLVAISLMVAVWIGATIALDRWYWKPKAAALPVIPPIQLGRVGNPEGLPPQNLLAPKSHRIARNLSILLISLFILGAHAPFFLHGPSELLVLLISLIGYPFVYALSRIVLTRLQREPRS